MLSVVQHKDPCTVVVSAFSIDCAWRAWQALEAQRKMLSPVLSREFTDTEALEGSFFFFPTRLGPLAIGEPSPVSTC